MSKLVFLSDTHNQHRQFTDQVVKAQANILVHCGDFCEDGTLSEVRDFAEWCEMLLRKGYVQHVVAVAGNHDNVLDGNAEARKPLQDAGVDYLQDSGVVVDGLSFYGIPWSSYCGPFGFQTRTSDEDSAVFSTIPSGLDVLVTHEPPLGVLDRYYRSESGYVHLGSPALLERLVQTKPRVHAFGHIHNQTGQRLLPNGTLCINACSLTEEDKVRKTGLPALTIAKSLQKPLSVWETGEVTKWIAKDSE